MDADAETRSLRDATASRGSSVETTFVGKVSSFRPSDKGADIDFVDCTSDDVGRVAEQFLAGIGLDLEQGSIAQGIYGSGSKAGRAIGGGLIKRRKYVASISATDAGVRLSMMSGMSGIGGSLLGLMRERKQRKAFVASLTAYLDRRE
jgi:hypothetical protein